MGACTAPCAIPSGALVRTQRTAGAPARPGGPLSFQPRSSAGDQGVSVNTSTPVSSACWRVHSIGRYSINLQASIMSV